MKNILKNLILLKNVILIKFSYGEMFLGSL